MERVADRDRAPAEGAGMESKQPPEPRAPARHATGPPGGEGSRLDRELAELLQELRVILPGVQVLFAFLLAVPFTNRFQQTDAVERAVFLVALLATAAASVLAIAPGAQHRIRWRRYDKNHLLEVANRLALAATVALALAMSAAVFLIADVLYGRVAGIVFGAMVALLAAALWWGMPLARRRARRADPVSARSRA